MAHGIAAMPLVLLLFGVVTAVAGLVVVAAGLPIRDGAFDTEILTPGTIAAVGGLLLVGLGLAVRELRRIERVLAARPMPRAVRPGEVAASPEAAEVVPRLPIPFEPKADIRPIVAATVNEAERLRSKFPILMQPEDVAVAEGGDLSAGSRATAHAKANGAEPASAMMRVTNASDLRTRPSVVASKTNGPVLGSFSRLKVRRDGQAAAAPAVQAAVVQDAASANATASEEGSVSILKSGVVEGMAYTLYSDGSIEAQLPQGTQRFGSISALRSHMESTA
jgi:hypothetical protein